MRSRVINALGPHGLISLSHDYNKINNKNVPRIPDSVGQAINYGRSHDTYLFTTISLTYDHARVVRDAVKNKSENKAV